MYQKIENTYFIGEHEMDEVNQYIISTETKYIKDYQSEHYRAIITDDKNRKIRTGTEWFFSEEQALEDGERMLSDLNRSNKLAKYDIHFTRKVFIDVNGFSKSMKYNILIVLIPTFLSLSISIIYEMQKPFISGQMDITGLLITIGVLLLSILILAINQFNFGGNMVSYVLYEGDFYRVFLSNDNVGTAQLVSKHRGLVAGAALILKGERNRQVRQALLNRDSYLRMELNTNNCWKLLEVLRVTHKKGCYKIKCVVEKGKRQKVCNKTLYIRKGYNDFEQLISCFEYLLDCSTEH